MTVFRHLMSVFSDLPCFPVLAQTFVPYLSAQIRLACCPIICYKTVSLTSLRRPLCLKSPITRHACNVEGPWSANKEPGAISSHQMAWKLHFTCHTGVVAANAQRVTNMFGQTLWLTLLVSMCGVIGLPGQR